MREILFKAKRIDNGEWITGYLLVKKKDFYICEKPYECMGEYSSLNGQSYGFGGFKFVEPSTICQCTGLKDKNGRKIWENDILSIGKKMDSIGNYYHPPVKYPTNVLVRWDLCAWLWETISKNKNEKYYISFPDAWCHYEAEVIGNIFDEGSKLLYGE